MHLYMPLLLCAIRLLCQMQFPQGNADLVKTPGLHHFRQAGMQADELGTVLSHTGYLYIPMSLTLPKFHIIGATLELCTPSNKQTILILESANAQLLSQIPEGYGYTLQNSSRTVRNKRFAPLLLGGFGLAGSIWNRVSITSLNSKVKRLDKSVYENSKRITRLQETTIELAHTQDMVVHVVNKLSSTLTTLLRNFTCEDEKIVIFQNALLSYFVSALPHFIRAVDSALLGRVMPDLINYKDLTNLIAHHPDMSQGLYQDLPNLVYELGSFILYKIEKDPAILTGVIVVPRLSTISHGTLLKLGSVPMKSKNGYWQIITPQTAVWNTMDNSVWVPNPLDCTTTPALWVCPSSYISAQSDLCLTEMYQRGEISSCTIKLIPKTLPPSALLLTGKSGILISNAAADLKIVRVLPDRELSIIAFNSTIKNQSTFLSSNLGDYIIYNGQHFALHRAREDFVIRDMTIDFKYISMLMDAKIETLQEDKWVGIADRFRVDLERTPFPLTEVLIGCGSSFLILCLVVVIVVRMRKHCRKIVETPAVPLKSKFQGLRLVIPPGAQFENVSDVSLHSGEEADGIEIA